MKVFKIAKPGFDPLTADPKNLIFDSELNTLKNKLSGSFTESLSAFETFTQTIAHGLSGRPLCMAYYRDTANSNWYIVGTTFGVSFEQRIGLAAHAEIYIDATNVYIKLANNATPRTVEVQYEIFYENLS